jgi:flavin reductase (DIM6/NTAB) family NADH-FMN oxidoreductase RutF
MLLNLQNTSPQENYKALTKAVLPRPLLWVLTENGDGCTVAPYSFANILSTEPPLVSIAFGIRPGQEQKGTYKALHEKKKAVLHLTDETQKEDILKSAEKGSFYVGDVNLVRDVEGFPPRIQNSPVALFCTYYDTLDIKDANTHLVICKIEHIYMSEDFENNIHPLTCVGAEGVVTLR